MSKRVVVALTTVVLVALAVARAVDLWWWRAQALRAADARAANLALILSEYVREVFAAGDASLRQLALRSSRTGGASISDAEWDASLASAKAGLTGVGSLSVTDAAGIIRHSTQPAIVGQSRSDDYMFKRLAAARTDEFVVDQPFLSAVEPRQYIVPIGRRLTTPSGAFAGAIVAVIMPASVHGVFHTIDVGTHGSVWVFHPSGVVLFRDASDGARLGESAAANPIFQAAIRSGGSGVLEQALAPGGPVLRSAYHVTASPPLVVAVSLDRSEILTDWLHQAIGSVLLYAFLVGMTCLAVAALFRQIEAERRARTELEAASRLKDEFLMTVSHELRTPLTTIYGWARMLNTGTLRDDQRPAALQTIERNARVQTKLIEDLLDMARIIEGKLHLDLQPVPIDEVVTHAVEDVRPSAAAKNVRVEVDVAPSAGAVIGDRERLHQVLLNLLSNAIKFTEPGGCATIAADARGTTVEIVVSDTGSGISAEFLPFVFDRFRQEQSGTRRAYGGLGIGLAIVRHLVELHGGTVTAESAGSSRGAAFHVRLPRAAESVASGERGALHQVEARST